MYSTPSHATYMSKMIQLRNVPDNVHRILKIRATEAGMSLSEFLVREVTHIAQRPSVDELLARIQHRPAVTVSEESVAAVRAERDTRR